MAKRVSRKQLQGMDDHAFLEFLVRNKAKLLPDEEKEA